MFREALAYPINRAFDCKILLVKRDTAVIHEAHTRKQLWEAKERASRYKHLLCEMKDDPDEGSTTFKARGRGKIVSKGMHSEAKYFASADDDAIILSEEDDHCPDGRGQHKPPTESAR